MWYVALYFCWQHLAPSYYLNNMTHLAQWVVVLTQEMYILVVLNVCHMVIIRYYFYCREYSLFSIPARAVQEQAVHKSAIFWRVLSCIYLQQLKNKHKKCKRIFQTMGALFLLPSQCALLITAVSEIFIRGKDCKKLCSHIHNYPYKRNRSISWLKLLSHWHYFISFVEGRVDHHGTKSGRRY